MSRAHQGKDPRRPTLGTRLPSGFQRLGSPRERALVLAMSGQHMEAATLLMEALLEGHPDLASGARANRHLATLAARYLAAGGDREGAAAIHDALGEADRAAELRRAASGGAEASEPGAAPRSEAPEDVARTGSEAAPVPGPPGPGSPAPGAAAAPADPPETTDPAASTRPPDTLESLVASPPASGGARPSSRTTFIAQGASLAAAGKPFEAATCYLKAGDAQRGLELLCGITEAHERYDDAARLMIRILVKHRLSEAPLLAFVLPYLRRGPRDAGEQSLFRTLRGFLEDVGALAEVPGLRTSPRLEDSKPSASGGAAKTPEPAARGARPPEAAPPLMKPLHKDPRMAATMMTEIPKVPEDPRQLGGAETVHVALGEAASLALPDVATPRSPAPPAAAPSVSPGGFPFVPGVVVDGRYGLIQVLGSGGMATVFETWDEELEERIALKVYRQVICDDEIGREGLARFRQELKVSRRLYHPNLIRLYDIGVHLGYRYLTMELLEGHPLDALLGEPIEPKLGLAWLRQIAAGLAEAHRHGVIHRDVKPENVFVTREGVLKIMDFGIAKSHRERGVTLAGTTAGTPEYMAPEQINRFSEVGGAADQYSLGVVAYQIFTGVLPFEHPELVPLLMAHVQEPPPPLRDRLPGIDPDVEALVLRLLAKSPADRFPSCDALVEHVSALQVSLGG